MRPGAFGKSIVTTLHRIPVSFLFLFYCLVFVHPLLDDTLPGLKVHPTTIHGAGSDKQPKRDFGVTLNSIIQSGQARFSAAFIQTFVKLDRKQNTRLWPFIDAGTTRSPPHRFL
jgi:hypothetical protein